MDETKVLNPVDVFLALSDVVSFPFRLFYVLIHCLFCPFLIFPIISLPSFSLSFVTSLLTIMLSALLLYFLCLFFFPPLSYYFLNLSSFPVFVRKGRGSTRHRLPR